MPDEQISFVEIAEKASYLGLAIFIGLYAMPVPVGIAILPLLFACVALSVRLQSAKPGGVAKLATKRLALLFVFAGSYCLSIVNSMDLQASLQPAALFLPGALVMFLVFTATKSEYGRIILARGFVGCIFVFSALYLFAYLRYPGVSSRDVLSGLNSLALVVPNDLSICLVLMPFLAWAYCQESTVSLRTLCAAVALVFAVALALSSSRLCFIGSIFLATLILGVTHRKWALIPVIVVGALITLFLFDMFLNTGALSKLFSPIANNGRLSVWYVGLTQWISNPMLGSGPNTFEPIYRNAVTGGAIPEWMPIDGRNVTWAHSLLIEALLERGIAGFLILSLVLFDLYRVFLKRVNTAKFDFNMALLLSLTLFIFLGALELSFQRNWVVIIFCFLVGCYLGGDDLSSSRPSRHRHG